jgi:ABC-2 type transport system permease protein
MNAWLLLVRARGRERWRAPTDALVGVLADLVGAFVGLAMVLAVFTRVDTFAGLDQRAMIACWGVGEVARGIAGLVSRPVAAVPSRYVLDGGLDRLLLRPSPVLAQVIAEGVNPIASLPALWGAWAALAACAQVGVAEVTRLAIGGALGALLMGGVALAVAATGFWIPQRGGAVSVVWQATSFAAWPPDALSGPLRWLLVTALPFTFAGYAPGCWLLGLPTHQWMHAWPVVSIACGVAGALVWRAGLRRYGSSGS